jgi:hypothetical protein
MSLLVAIVPSDKVNCKVGNDVETKVEISFMYDLWSEVSDNRKYETRHWHQI